MALDTDWDAPSADWDDSAADWDQIASTPVSTSLWGDHMGISITNAGADAVPYVVDMGMRWIRTDVEDPPWGLDTFAELLTAAHAAGLKVLASIQDSGDDAGDRYAGWGLDDYTAFADWAVTVADMGPDAIEVGNELNNPTFNANRDADETVAALLTNVVADAVHAAHPDIPIITAGWSPWGDGPPEYYPQNAVNALLGNDTWGPLKQKIQGVGYHPYEMDLHPQESTTNPAWNACWWLRESQTHLNAAGVSVPFWLTEFGKWGTPADQATWASDYFIAFEAHRAAGVKIETVFWHTLYEGDSDLGGDETTLGLYRNTGTVDAPVWVAKPAVAVLRAQAAKAYAVVTDPDPENPPVDPPVVLPPGTEPEDPGTGTDIPVGGWYIGLRGLTIGADPLEWVNGPSIFGWASPRNSDEDRPGGHGALSFGPDLLNKKNLDFVFLVNKFTELDAHAIWEQIAAAWRPSRGGVVRLDVGTPRRRYIVYGKPDQIEPNIEFIQHGILQWVKARFRATDPLFYGLPRTIVGQLAVSTGGRSYPRTYPMVYGSANVGGVTVLNDGNIDSERLEVTLEATTEALVNPRVELADTGEALQFDLTIQPGDRLVIDFSEWSADLNGTASRTGALRRPGSTFFSIPPGEHLIRFGGLGSGRMTAVYSAAWNL